MNDSSRTLLQVAAIIGVLTVFLAGWVLKQREVRDRSEADVIRHLQQTTAAPEAQLVSSTSFEGKEEDPELSAALRQLSLGLQGPFSTCLDRWPGAPSQARARVVADPAGRLITLAVEGAPPQASSCLLAVMRRAQLPRNADGVGLLLLSPG